ncbi:LANO_0A02630g1_1 [Lachancea nothofagi CBS 11611]|uniref:LANO_0A02630g1_1 n=1 Tax=Lachancea nothofagi CBS 11611 TaxID=1266666 RepID=A0A1G4INU4_9SACH|nr:LANO_0A02630g1_1 [Lachancea nothofagi CBS 11611]
MYSVFNENGWLVVVHRNQLLVWQNKNLVIVRENDKLRDFQCFTTGDELSIFGSKGGSLIRLWMDRISNHLNEECVLNASFSISKFRVLPEVGWILATDSVSGVLHVFDTISERYKGHMKVDPGCDRVYVNGTREFQIMTRSFDPDSLVIKTYLNMYEIVEDETSLVSSIPIDSKHSNRWVCQGSNSGQLFAVISTDGSQGSSTLDFYLPRAQVPFQKIVLAQTIQREQTWFSSSFALVVVLQAPQGLELCDIDVITGQKTRSVLLNENSISAYYHMNVSGQEPDYLEKHHFSNATAQFLRIVHCVSRSTVFFVLNSAPEVLLGWHNSRLQAWWFPAAILGVITSTDSTIGVECASGTPKQAIEIFHVAVPRP